MERLPPTLHVFAEMRADEPQRLAPLPGTSLHGALDDALSALACACPRGDGAPAHAEACVYAQLTKPGSDTLIPGASARSPAPMSLSVDAPLSAAAPIVLPAGGAIRFRVTLIGEQAIDRAPVVAAALRRAAVKGIGLRARGAGTLGEDGPRPRLQIGRVWVDPMSSHRDGASSGAVTTLDLWSPLRLKSDGAFAHALDASLLWRGILRRAAALSTKYGDGLLFDRPGPKASFTLEPIKERSVTTRRWSSRQHQRMKWPGLVGSYVLRGLDEPAWRLLLFASAVQLGSGTCFGFGRIDVGMLNGGGER